MKAWIFACTATASLLAACGGDSSSSEAPNSGNSATHTSDAGAHPPLADAGADRIDAGGAASLWASAGLPPLDDDAVAHVHEQRALGQTMGARLNVFAKVGDSTTASTNNLWFFGQVGKYSIGNHTELVPTIEVFHFVVSDDHETSFDRQSLAGIGGWTAEEAMKPPSGVEQELAEIKPAYALVMFGTNDLETFTVDQYRANMTKVLDAIESKGIVVSLSTINDRLDFDSAHGRVIAYNDVIRDLARTRHLALLDLYAALEPLPNHGVADEGIHPSVSPDPTYGGADLSDEAVKFGYNFRNLLQIQMLDRLRAIP